MELVLIPLLLLTPSTPDILRLNAFLLGEAKELLTKLWSRILDTDEEVSFFACLRYAFWISGDHTQPKRDGDLSTTELYPDLEYKSIESILQP
jgi:hypothetical protein